MSKRIAGFLLASCVLLTLLPIPIFAEEVEGVAVAVAYANIAKYATPNYNPPGSKTDVGEDGEDKAETYDFFTSDVEACEGQWWYEIDDGGRILRTKDIHAHDFYVTDYAVSQILVLRNIVYATAGNIIYAINPDNSAQENALTANNQIERFAIRGDELFYLAGGVIYKTAVQSKQSVSVVNQSKAIFDFWLEDYNTLSYMIDQNLIYDLNLNTGSVNQRANMRSSLETEDSENGEVSLLGVSGLAALKAKFPDGKYWNHVGNAGAENEKNNQDGYTDLPCPVHGVVGTSKQTCNGFQPGDAQLSWQCMGYAEKCGYDMTGYNPRKDAHGWNTYEDSSALDNLKAGDIVRYKDDGHSIYITKVSGNTVTYTDCNHDGTCVIRWDASIQKSTLGSTFTYVRSAPSAAQANDELDTPVITKTTTDSTTAITVAWDKVSGATKYSLWWRIASGTWTEIPDLTGTSKKVTGLEAAQRYNFYVVAHDSERSSERSDTVMSYTLNNAPTIERISDTSLKLTWDKPKNAQSYAIWRRKHDGSYKKIISGVTDREYTDTSLKAGTRYYYYVVSSNATNSATYPDCTSKERAYSTYMAAPVLTVSGQNSITLEWKQNSSDATYDNFEIYRKANNTGGFEKIDSVQWSKISYTDKGLTENTTYEYYVKAAGDGYSVPSLTSKAVTDAKATITQATADSTTAITVTWEKVGSATRYSLWWRIASGTWTEIPDLIGTSKKVTGLEVAQRYNFYVVAYNGKVEISRSDTVMSYTLNNAPTVERLSDTSLKLTWDTPKNAQSYTIWRKKYDGTYQRIASGITETAYTDTGLKAGTRYYYYVISANATNSATYPDCTSKERAYSTYMAAPVLTVSGQNSITLEWKQNSSDATYDNFEIYRKADNTGDFEKIASVKWDKTSYADTGLTENTTYEYYVKAVGDGYFVPSLKSKVVTDAKRSLASVEIASRPDKVIYEINEAWADDGLRVKAVYSDGTSEILTSGFTVTGFDSSSVGEKTITVAYQGKSATFTVNVTESAPSVAQLVIGSQSASPGGQVTVPVSLKSNPGVVGFSFAIEYDAEKLEYLGAADGNFPGIADNVSAEGNQLGFAYSSASDANLSGETIVKLTFQAKSGAKGTAKLRIVMDEDFGDSFRAFNSETRTIAPVNVDTQDGEITIADLIPGDVNGSGRVDNDDLILLTRYRARWKVNINMDAADVDGSGKVDNDDLILLTRYRARWKVTLLPGKVSSQS